MGLFDSILGGGDSGSSVGFATPEESQEVKDARKRLAAIAADEPPDVPLRKIAPLQPVTEERELARKTAKESLVPQEQQDFLSLPEVQGAIDRILEEGNILANRLGRGLQATGSFTSTPGRDILGRAVSDVENRLASVFGPQIEAQRGRAERERLRIQQLIPVLEGLGLTEEDRARFIEQAELGAEFEQQTTESQQLQTFTIPILQSIISNQPSAVPIISGQGGGGGFGDIAQLIGPLLTSVLGGGSTGGKDSSGGGGSALGGASPTGSTSSDVQLALTLAAAFSDMALKTDVETIPNALDKILQLDGKSFKFIGGDKSGGVIAQEIEKVMPEAVSEKDGFKTVDYTAIIGLLINAVKELAIKAQE